MDSSQINYSTPIITEDGNLKMFCFDDTNYMTQLMNDPRLKIKVRELEGDEFDHEEWINNVSSLEGKDKIINDYKLELYKEYLTNTLKQFHLKYLDDVLETLMLHLGSTGIATVHIFEFESAPILYTTKGNITLPSWFIQINTEMSRESAFKYEGMEQAQDEGYISHKFGYLSRDYNEVIEGLKALSIQQLHYNTIDVLSTYLLLTKKSSTLLLIDEYNYNQAGLENIKYAKEHFGNLLTSNDPYKL